MTDKHFPDALPIGERVFNYQIESVLGQGGFGIVYKAVHPVTRRRVALKELFPAVIGARRSGTRVVYSHLDASESKVIKSAREKFQYTTTLQCSLDHPSICKVLEYQEANDTAYMLMEFLEGTDLGEWLARQLTPLSIDRLQAVFAPVLDALDYLHGRGLIHRDIKPGNIFMLAEDRPILIDFGALSHDLTIESREAGVKTGTQGIHSVGYTAPELCKSRVKPNIAGDIYAFGGLLYFALSGRKPVDGYDRRDSVFDTGVDPYQPLARASLTEVEFQFVEVIDSCLAYREKDRPKSVAVLRQRLGWNSDPPSFTPEIGPKALNQTILVAEGWAPSSTGDSQNNNTITAFPPTNRPKIAAWLLAGTSFIAVSVGGVLFYLNPPTTLVVPKPPPVEKPDPRKPQRDGDTTETARLHDLILACDRASASPSDADRPNNVTGIEFDAIDAKASLLACSAAADALDRAAAPSPIDKRRVQLELGRSFERAQSYRDARTWYEKAAAAGNAEAMNDLAGR